MNGSSRCGGLGRDHECGGKSRLVSLAIARLTAREVGFVDGWPFASGDRVVLHADSFADVDAVAP